MKHRRRDGELLLSTEAMRRALEAQANCPEDHDKLREVGHAYERYDANLRSRWDSYEGAIAAAEGDPDHEPDPDRLIDCLRGHKPFADGDRDRLANFIAKKMRRRCWPLWLVDALSRAPTGDEYERLSDLVAKVGRKRGRMANVPAHRAARLARVLLWLVSLQRVVVRLARAKGEETDDAPRRDDVIGYACGIDVGIKEPVPKLLDNARDTKRQ